MDNETKKAFYDECAAILGIAHEWNEPAPRRTRWNNRRIGNGRFVGFGLVQCFGSMFRVVSKRGTKTFKTKEEVFDYLKGPTP